MPSAFSGNSCGAPVVTALTAWEDNVPVSSDTVFEVNEYWRQQARERIRTGFTVAPSARLMRVTHRPLLERAPATGQISCNAGGAARLGDIRQQLK